MANGEFGGGSGTREDPYLVEDAMDLDAVREDLLGHYLQTSDIDLGAWGNWTPIGGLSSGSGTTLVFSGSYDGGGYSISNITCEHPESNRVGLFGALAPIILNEDDPFDDWITIEADISNVHVENSIVSGDSEVGGIVGLAQSYSGGSASIRDCSYVGLISGGEMVGGIVGYSSGFSLFRCSTSIETPSSGPDNFAIGGIIGINYFSNITVKDCTSHVSISNSTSVAGGIVGGSYGFIEIVNCLSTGLISASNYRVAGFGGILGYSEPNDGEVASAVLGGCFSLLDSILVPDEQTLGYSGSMIGRLDGSHVLDSCFTIDTFLVRNTDGSLFDSTGIQSLTVTDNLTRLVGSYTRKESQYDDWLSGDSRLARVPYGSSYDIIKLDSDDFFYDVGDYGDDYITYTDEDNGFLHTIYKINNIGQITIPGSQGPAFFIYAPMDEIETNFDLLDEHGDVVFPSTGHDFSQYSPSISTYWDFGKVWGIEEGVTRPFLIRKEPPIDTEPSTTRGSLIRVNRDNEGTMFFDGKVYRYDSMLSYTQFIDKEFFSQKYFIVIELLAEEHARRAIRFIASDEPLILDLGEGSAIASNDKSKSFSALLVNINPEDAEVIRTEMPREIERTTEYKLNTTSGDFSPVLVHDSNYDVLDETGALIVGENEKFDPLNYFDVHVLDADTEGATFSFYGASVKDLEDDEVLMFIASSVEDPDYPGGYGHYEALTQRTAEFLDERGNKVNFYYTNVVLPDYDYLIKVASDGGNIPIVLLNDKRSYIRCATHDGEITNVSLVEVDSNTASPIKVMTPDGMMALEALTLEV